MVNSRGLTRKLVGFGALSATALAAHTAYNVRKMRKPSGNDVAEPVSVLIPARNEAHRIGPTIASIIAQDCASITEIIVLDDESTDGTADVVLAAAHGDPRVRVVSGQPLPDGWLGKPWACEQLGRIATGSVLVFTDADVHFEPHAISATVTEMRAANLELLSPYPKQLAETWAERIFQPMVTWSWAAALPIGIAERSSRPSLSAAIGQFIVVDAHAYRSSGGHASVRDCVIEDIMLLRTFKRAGFRGVAANGASLASCRMYATSTEVVDGYTKSLWYAFGSKRSAAVAITGMGIVYIAPPIAMLLAKDKRTKAYGAIGYASGVTSRVLTARAFDERSVFDGLAHPVTMLGVGALTTASWIRKQRGTLTWKGRNVSHVEPASRLELK